MTTRTPRDGAASVGSEQPVHIPPTIIDGINSAGQAPEGRQDLAAVAGLPPVSPAGLLAEPDADADQRPKPISSPGSPRTWTAAASTPGNEGIDQKGIESGISSASVPATESSAPQSGGIAPLDHHGNDQRPVAAVVRDRGAGNAGRAGRRRRPDHPQAARMNREGRAKATEALAHPALESSSPPKMNNGTAIRMKGSRRNEAEKDRLQGWRG